VQGHGDRATLGIRAAISIDPMREEVNQFPAFSETHLAAQATRPLTARPSTHPVDPG
jgi:hypothetical protein